MADIAFARAGRIEVVGIPDVQRTFVAGETITPGDLVYIDGTTGRIRAASAGAAGTAGIVGVAIPEKDTVYAGEACTVLQAGKISGLVLTDVAYGAPVYLSNTAGLFADAAGTVSTIAGRCYPAHGQLLGALPDKILRINL